MPALELGCHCPFAVLVSQNRRLHLFYGAGKQGFLPTEKRAYISGLFLATLGPRLQSFPLCTMLVVIESTDVYLIELALQPVTRRRFPAFCRLLSPGPPRSCSGCPLPHGSLSRGHTSRRTRTAPVPGPGCQPGAWGSGQRSDACRVVFFLCHGFAMCDHGRVL